jgi:hypothetical protein
MSYYRNRQQINLSRLYPKNDQEEFKYLLQDELKTSLPYTQKEKEEYIKLILVKETK